jgi:hypothetical protein
MLLTLISVIALCQSPQYVNGYRKSNGTYVQGYYRTSANHNVRDNFSTYPNVNPYTGKTGTKHYNYNSSTTYNYKNTYNSSSNYHRRRR